jgi:hypothetical protein
MRKLSNKAIALQVLMVFLLLTISVFGAPSSTKPKTNPAKSRVSKKLAPQQAANAQKTEKTETTAQKAADSDKDGQSGKIRKLEVDQAQLFLAKGIQRIVEHDSSLECS